MPRVWLQLRGEAPAEPFAGQQNFGAVGALPANSRIPREQTVRRLLFPKDFRTLPAWQH